MIRVPGRGFHPGDVERCDQHGDPTGHGYADPPDPGPPETPAVRQAHQWEYDRHDRHWYCRVCTKPYTGRGPNRRPDPGVCDPGARRDVERPWGRIGEDGGGLDEVVVESRPGAEIRMFHLERMDIGAYWMAVYLADGTVVTVSLGAVPGQPRVVAGAAEEG